MFVRHTSKASKAKGMNKTGEARRTTTSDLANPRSGLIGTRSLVQVAPRIVTSHKGQHSTIATPVEPWYDF